MAERFELDTRGLFTFLQERGIDDAPSLGLREVVGVWSDEDRYRHASTPLVLAQLTYLLGISPLVARPEDFPAHCLLGVAGTFHGQSEFFMVALCCPDGPLVCAEHTNALKVLGDSPKPRGFRLVQSVSEAILSHADSLIPVARAANSVD